MNIKKQIIYSLIIELVSIRKELFLTEALIDVLSDNSRYNPFDASSDISPIISESNFNDEKCREYLEAQRWGGTPCCVFCGSTHVSRLKRDTRRFQCNEKECKKQFSVTVGTIAENTKIPLTKWFLAADYLRKNKKQTSVGLSNKIGVTQKTAWYLIDNMKN